jgi:hypothetical protein
LAVFTPRWAIRGAAIAFLWACLGFFVAAVPAALGGTIGSIAAVWRAQRRRDRGALLLAMRWLALATSCVLALIVLEAGSAAKLRRVRRMAELPTHFAARTPSGAPRFSSGDPVSEAGKPGSRNGSPSAAGDDLYVVVAGESSALGSPYDPWISIGQITGWQLEQVFPGRKVRVDIRAEGGLCLEQSIARLTELAERPDAIVVFAGHNEFQTRFGWPRNVRHYLDEGPQSPLFLLDLARSTFATTGLILATLDRYHGETPAPRHATRELVDHPICSPHERAFLLDDFTRRLDELAGYCGRIGALAVLITPPSNDGAYEPNRSILAASTLPRERAAFANEFQAVRASEAQNPQAAIAAYRRLVGRHPEFAECHYRLGRLLVDAGIWDEAREQLLLARDLDAFPLRCPTDFRDAIRAVARRHDAILIDAPTLLSGLAPHGILDDRLFHDAHHLNLAGYTALAQEVLVQLRRRRAFGWPESTPVPSIELGDVARYFALDAAKWSTICERSSDFYNRTACVRFDPTERFKVTLQYRRAASELAAGRPLQPDDPPSLTTMSSIIDDPAHAPLSPIPAPLP